MASNTNSRTQADISAFLDIVTVKQLSGESNEEIRQQLLATIDWVDRDTRKSQEAAAWKQSQNAAAEDTLLGEAPMNLSKILEDVKEDEDHDQVPKRGSTFAEMIAADAAGAGAGGVAMTPIEHFVSTTALDRERDAPATQKLVAEVPRPSSDPFNPSAAPAPLAPAYPSAYGSPVFPHPWMPFADAHAHALAHWHAARAAEHAHAVAMQQAQAHAAAEAAHAQHVWAAHAAAAAQAQVAAAQAAKAVQQWKLSPEDKLEQNRNRSAPLGQQRAYTTTHQVLVQMPDGIPQPDLWQSGSRRMLQRELQFVMKSIYIAPQEPVMVTLHIWNCATKEEEAMAVERVRNELRPDGWRAGMDSFGGKGSTNADASLGSPMTPELSYTVAGGRDPATVGGAGGNKCRSYTVALPAEVPRDGKALFHSEARQRLMAELKGAVWSMFVHAKDPNAPVSVTVHVTGGTDEATVAHALDRVKAELRPDGWKFPGTGSSKSLTMAPMQSPMTFPAMGGMHTDTFASILEPVPAPPQFSDEFSQQIFAHLDRKASGGNSDGERSYATVSSTPTPPPPGLAFDGRTQ